MLGSDSVRFSRRGGSNHRYRKGLLALNVGGNCITDCSQLIRPKV